MGLIRKTLSASTLGAVDFRSDKERIARNTKAQVRATKETNKLLREQGRRDRMADERSRYEGDRYEG